MMFKKYLRYFLCLLLAFTACTQNLIAGFSNKNTDPALYQDALDQINASNWLAAITDIQSMSAAGQSGRNVMFTFATALAGECGFQLGTFFTGLSNSWSGGGTPSSILLTLMQSYTGATINMTVAGATAPTLATDPTTNNYCAWSQQIMDNIQANYGVWNSNEQTFVVFFALARMGMILQVTAGAGATTNGAGKQIPDVTFNACKVASMNDFYATQMVAAMALFLNNYTIIPFLSSLNSGGVSLLTALCGPVAGGNLAMNFCSHMTPVAVTNNDRFNVRGMITGSTANPAFDILTVLDKVYADASTDPGGGIWQCDGLAYTPPPVEGLLNCCP